MLLRENFPVLVIVWGKGLGSGKQGVQSLFINMRKPEKGKPWVCKTSKESMTYTGIGGSAAPRVGTLYPLFTKARVRNS